MLSSLAKWREARARELVARRDASEVTELRRFIEDLTKAVDELGRRTGRIEARLEEEIDAYIRRLNAASRKYLKAEQERAMRMLPGEDAAELVDEQVQLQQGDVMQRDLYLSPKAHIRHRVKARKESP